MLVPGRRRDTVTTPQRVFELDQVLVLVGERASMGSCASVRTLWIPRVAPCSRRGPETDTYQLSVPATAFISKTSVLTQLS